MNKTNKTNKTKGTHIILIRSCKTTSDMKVDPINIGTGKETKLFHYIDDFFSLQWNQKKLV